MSDKGRIKSIQDISTESWPKRRQREERHERCKSMFANDHHGKRYQIDLVHMSLGREEKVCVSGAQSSTVGEHTER